MVEGWLDEVTDATIWGRVTGEDVTGPVPLRIEVDGRLWGTPGPPMSTPTAGRGASPSPTIWPTARR